MFLKENDFPSFFVKKYLQDHISLVGLALYYHILHIQFGRICRIMEGNKKEQNWEIFRSKMGVKM